MYGRLDEETERPLPEQADNAQEEVDDLKDGDGFDGAIEVLGRKVPEDLGPEETLDRCRDLVGGGGEDDEAGPVVLD